MLLTYYLQFQMLTFWQTVLKHGLNCFSDFSLSLVRSLVHIQGIGCLVKPLKSMVCTWAPVYFEYRFVFICYASSILPSWLLLENKNAAVPISSKCCTFSKWFEPRWVFPIHGEHVLYWFGWCVSNSDNLVINFVSTILFKNMEHFWWLACSLKCPGLWFRKLCISKRSSLKHSCFELINFTQQMYWTPWVVFCHGHERFPTMPAF